MNKLTKQDCIEDLEDFIQAYGDDTLEFYFQSSKTLSEKYRLAAEQAYEYLRHCDIENMTACDAIRELSQ